MTAREEVSRQDSRERPVELPEPDGTDDDPWPGPHWKRSTVEKLVLADRAAEAQRPSVAGADVLAEVHRVLVGALNYAPDGATREIHKVLDLIHAAAPRPPAAADEREAFDAFVNDRSFSQMPGARDGWVAALQWIAARSHPVAPAATQERCDTTGVERFVNPACVCKTYDGNLGPCAAHEVGCNGRCVWCDHEMTCVAPAATQDERESFETLFDKALSAQALYVQVSTAANSHALGDAAEAALAAFDDASGSIRRAAPAIVEECTTCGALCLLDRRGVIAVGEQGATSSQLPSDPAATQDEPSSLSLNVRHPKYHEAADAFWKYWEENGETHKHGYYESTWGAINRALRMIGVVHREER